MSQAGSGGGGGGGRRLPSRFYAYEVVGGMEERVAMVIAERALVKGLDIRSVVVPSDMKGMVIVEVGNMAHLYDAIYGVRHIKRRRPMLIKREEMERIVKPVVEIPKLKRGDVVEIVSGLFRGRKAKVVDVNEARNEVQLIILDASFDAVVTLSLDEVRKVEEGK